MPRDNRTWLQRQQSRWTPPLAIGALVTVSGNGGYTIAGYDYATRKYRVTKPAPGAVDTVVDPSVVVAG